jgi:xanthosine utilization system XapX-like protein
MDLSRGAAFNYQGVGASQFLVMLPLLLLPVLIYAFFSLFMDRIPAASILGLLGLIGLLFHKTLMQQVVKRFERRKYKIAEGFREK